MLLNGLKMAGNDQTTSGQWDVPVIQWHCYLLSVVSWKLTANLFKFQGGCLELMQEKWQNMTLHRKVEASLICKYWTMLSWMVLCRHVDSPKYIPTQKKKVFLIKHLFFQYSHWFTCQSVGHKKCSQIIPHCKWVDNKQYHIQCRTLDSFYNCTRQPWLPNSLNTRITDFTSDPMNRKPDRKNKWPSPNEEILLFRNEPERWNLPPAFFSDFFSKWWMEKMYSDSYLI